MVVRAWVWLHAPEEFASVPTEEFGDLLLVVNDEELIVSTSVEARFESNRDALWTVAASTEGVGGGWVLFRRKTPSKTPLKRGAE